MICDPATKTCAAGQCSSASACPSGKTCLTQTETATVGACYPSCTPYGTPCLNGATCVLAAFDASAGACIAAGTGFGGQPCSGTALNTSCVTGYICAADGSSDVCRKQCKYWDAFPGCPGTQRCAFNGICFAETADSAAINAACASGSALGTPCGNDGSAWRGVCTDLGSGKYCYKNCRTAVASDCSSGQTCYGSVSSPEVGVCA
jgi:hypothetical protein